MIIDKPMRAVCADLTNAQVGDMMRLCEDRFGKGYITSDELMPYLEGRDHFCKVAMNPANQDLLGFSMYYASNVPEVADGFNLTESEIEDIIGGMDGNGKVCVIKSVALQRAAEGHGIANELLELSVEDMIRRGFGSMWGSAWIRKGGVIPAKKLLERNKFQLLRVAHMTFYDRTDYMCPDCGGRCHCDDAIYYRALK